MPEQLYVNSTAREIMKRNKIEQGKRYGDKAKSFKYELI